MTVRQNKQNETDEAERNKVKTIRVVIQYWIDNYASKRRKRVRHITRALERYIYPTIGCIPASECTTQHWVKAFKNMEHVPYFSGVILHNCRQALRYGNETGFCSSNSLSLLKVQTIGRISKPRDKVLSRKELKELWDYCGSIETSPTYDNEALIKQVKDLLIEGTTRPSERGLTTSFLLGVVGVRTKYQRL